MSRFEKVTVSLPTELLARIEHRRDNREVSRSEVVSELLWRGWRQVEADEREERYRAAYMAQPQTDPERAWAEEAAKDLFDESVVNWTGDNQAGDATS